MTDTYTYDVFGATRSHSGSSANAWLFAGELNDPAVGRAPYYLRARYYDPALGRFLSRDPLWGVADTPQSLSRYPYVVNNPASFVDPFGFWWGEDLVDKATECIGDVAECAGDVVEGVASAGGEVIQQIAEDVSDPNVWHPLAGAALIIAADAPVAACYLYGGALCASLLHPYEELVATPATAFGICLISQGEVDFGIPGMARLCGKQSSKRYYTPRPPATIPYSDWDAYPSKEGGFRPPVSIG